MKTFLKNITLVMLFAAWVMLSTGTATAAGFPRDQADVFLLWMLIIPMPLYAALMASAAMIVGTKTHVAFLVIEFGIGFALMLLCHTDAVRETFPMDVIKPRLIGVGLLAGVTISCSAKLLTTLLGIPVYERAA